MPSGIYERKPFTEAHKRNIGKNNVGMFGKFHTKATKDKMAKAKIGNRNGLETQFKRGQKTGAECWNWKGGITPLYEAIKGLTEFNQWRKAIYKQDYWTCQDCGSKYHLNAHHTKPFTILLAEFLQEYDQFSPYEDIDTLVRLAIKWQPFWTAEGITYCEDCHKLKHKQQ